jgi:phosphoadenosine phosphosulfate reductase
LRLDALDASARLRPGPSTPSLERLALTTSFGIQSAVLLHMVSELTRKWAGIPVPVIWVDTGYLPAETYRYAEQLCRMLPLHLHVVQAEISPARMEALHGRLWETGEAKDLETLQPDPQG